MGSSLGPDGPASFHGSREYRSLPGLRKVIVDRWTYTDLTRKTWIPVSSLAAHTGGVRFQDELPPVSDWQFLGIETDVNSFKLGILNDQVFTSPQVLIDLAAVEGYPVDESKRKNYDEVRAAEDNRMARFLAEKINVRTAWKLMMIQLANTCPLILQKVLLDRTHKAILNSWYLESTRCSPS